MISRFSFFKTRMEAAGLPSIFIETFAYYYEQLVAGETGYIPEAAILPVAQVPNVVQFPDYLVEMGRAVLPKTAVIKLNGGLGTSMGLKQAKSLLPVKEGYSFLDIIALQAQLSNVPLLLMNSFSTEADSMAALQKYSELHQELPQSFVQHKEPKVRKDNFLPAEWANNPSLEWCPPGHGDIYTALITSGTLPALLEKGYEYAFASNSDNLGAVIDLAILGYFAENRVPFMMEVADRTEMDKKGGHLAQRLDGQLILRESSQTPPEDTAVYQDITRHKYFNTNNLWFHLPTLYQQMRANNNHLALPMIRNSKTVDPRDPASTAVYQLETAIGSAIAAFRGAQAIRVPRSRFAPVKTTNDLLAVRSDAYTLTDDFRVVPTGDRRFRQLNVQLDGRFYKYVNDLDARFPHGSPSLKRCNSFEVEGDFCFGKDIVCQGDVCLRNETNAQIEIPDGTVLSGNHHCV
ncbi:UTP--glucose-1-phosphate uridylyltransferase [hydrothermal vent metagenome]|uniref:UTP--glucose-1-phosphate uridylyltransferase n=1 Tax=hydrothermal vent metagenome TaxID=652676 RepID=A0A3B0V5Q0_9ZZZZ